MATRSQVASLAATHALSDGLHLSADLVGDVLAAGFDLQLTKSLGGELRYQYRKYDDQVDNTQDGSVKTVLATLSLKW